MRISDHKELVEACEKETIKEKDYYWYLDLRKYGTGFTGGYGLGLEGFPMVIMNVDHIRDTCLFPRYVGRISP